MIKQGENGVKIGNMMSVGGGVAVSRSSLLQDLFPRNSLRLGRIGIVEYMHNEIRRR